MEDAGVGKLCLPLTALTMVILKGEKRDGECMGVVISMLGQRRRQP